MCSLQPWCCAASDIRWLWRKSWCYHSNQHIVLRGWRILIPNEDKVDVITPINTLFIGGGGFWSLMKIKLMLLPQSTFCSEGVAIFNVMMIMMWWCDDVMMMMMMMTIMTTMTIVSVEQRPAWGEYVWTGDWTSQNMAIESLKCGFYRWWVIPYGYLQ